MSVPIKYGGTFARESRLPLRLKSLVITSAGAYAGVHKSNNKLQSNGLKPDESEMILPKRVRKTPDAGREYRGEETAIPQTRS